VQVDVLYADSYIEEYRIDYYEECMSIVYVDSLGCPLIVGGIWEVEPNFWEGCVYKD
jgi:hypothetical protein